MVSFTSLRFFTDKKSFHHSWLVTVILTAFICISPFAEALGKRASAPYSYSNGQLYGPWLDGRDLGQVSFTLSEPVSEDARQAFITGLKLLHAFEYPEARQAFLNAQRFQTQNNGADFVMAIWGELMCSYQLLWFTRDFNAAEQTMARMLLAKQSYSGTLSASENVLIEASKRLFGNQDNSRMKWPYQTGSNIQLFYQYLDQQWTSDNELETEVRVFRNLAWLATRGSVRDYQLERQVIADMSEMIQLPELKNHPGLHHYLIHASESPFLSKELSQALESALWMKSLNEGEQNTSSVHLTHMPTHFYFARGDWVNTYTINLSAWNKSIQRGADLELDDSSLAFHEHLWRVYALLQAGLFEDAISDASDLYQRIQSLQAQSGTTEALTRVMRTYYAFEQAYLSLELPESSHHLDSLKQQTLSDSQMSGWGKTAYYFLKAWNALQQQQYSAATNYRNTLAGLSVDDSLSLSPMNSDAIPIMIEQLKAEELKQKNDLAGAIRIVKSIESDYLNMRWDHGVPLVVKPLYEYLAELYLEKGKSDVAYRNVQTGSGVTSTPTVVYISPDFVSAVEYFQKELDEFFPRRRKSLEGLEEASRLAQDHEASKRAQSEIATLNQALNYTTSSSNGANQGAITNLTLIASVVIFALYMVFGI